MDDKRVEDTDGLTAEERAEIIRRLSDKDRGSVSIKELLGEEGYEEFKKMKLDENDGWE